MPSVFVEQEVRDSRFRIQRLQDPFTTRSDVVEWLLVGVPDPLPVAQGAVCPLPPKTPSPSVSAIEDDRAISNPDLRLPFDTFKQHLARGTIVVVDVRSEGEFLSGHIPGAIWIPLQRITEEIAQLRAAGKAIVTYCS